MSKKILILEPSVTTQSLVAEKLEKSEYEFSFETNGVKFLVSIYNTMPCAILINAKCLSPKSTELVRLIKSIEKLKKIPVGVYATSDFAFEEHYMINTGADLFIHFETDDFPEKLDILVEKAKNKQLGVPVESDIIKTGIAERIFSFMKNVDKIDVLAENFLNLITDFCEVPAVSLFLNTEDSISSFYITAPNFTETETNDFLKVCISDFEEVFHDTNILKVNPQRCNAEHPIEKFHTGDIPLSAFLSIKILNTDGRPLGTLNAVREGSFTTHQTDLMQFATQLFSSFVENAIALKKILTFEHNIRKAFSRFVPEQIIDELVEGQESGQVDKMGVGEKRDVAILFSDIRSFTNISELNKPETIVGFLNRYFTIMCTIIKKHGGTIDKFIGDAIMALFGAPVSYEDNARRAVAAAYEMREALSSVPLEDLILPDGMTFDVGIGIHYGDVIVGSIGSNDKTDYSVIGDTVNLASRLEGLTKTYGAKILISQAVKDDIKTDEFIYRYLDDVKVKGKANSVPIYAIDRSLEEFSETYRDYYTKGFALYKQGVFKLAREYFEKAILEYPSDKAAKLMLERCEQFIKNPPENWDGAITFTTK